MINDRGNIVKRRKTLIRLLVMFVFITGMLLGCSKEEKQEVDKKAETIKATFFNVEKKDVEDFYEVSGTTISKNPARIVSKIMGTVIEVRFEEGQQVKKGDLLLLIDAPEIKAMADRSDSNIAEAEKALMMAKINAKYAESTFNRYEKLYKEKAISLQEFEGVEAKKNLAFDEVKRLESVLQQAKAEKERTQAMLSYTRIVSPIAGVVTEKFANIGVNVMPGSPLVTIETEKELRLEANVDEKLLLSLKKMQKLSIYFDAIQKEVLGTISEIVPSIDPVNRTFKLKINIPTNLGVKLGMYGIVRVPVGKKEVIIVPKKSILARGQLTYVYVVDTENRSTLRLVKCGVEKDGMVEILSGLTYGERIVLEADKAKDGAKIVGE